MSTSTVHASPAHGARHRVDRLRHAAPIRYASGLAHAPASTTSSSTWPPYAETWRPVKLRLATVRAGPLDELAGPRAGRSTGAAEVWGKSKEWLELPGGVQIPDSDALQADACGPGYSLRCLTRRCSSARRTSAGAGAKSRTSGRGALTFAKPVAAPAPKKPSNFHRKHDISAERHCGDGAP